MQKTSGKLLHLNSWGRSRALSPDVKEKETDACSSTGNKRRPREEGVGCTFEKTVVTLGGKRRQLQGANADKPEGPLIETNNRGKYLETAVNSTTSTLGTHGWSTLKKRTEPPRGR